jgi:hypothetical protein
MPRPLGAVLLLLLGASPALAQNFAPQSPPVIRPGSPAATICSTDYGWCPIQVVTTGGGFCYCFVPPATWISGSARYWPYEGPVSPYLNPHTAPPSTLR